MKKMWFQDWSIKEDKLKHLGESYARVTLSLPNARTKGCTISELQDLTREDILIITRILKAAFGQIERDHE